MKKTLTANCNVVKHSRSAVSRNGCNMEFQLIHVQLQTGDLFIPFRGEAVNGHKFVEQAFEKGCSGITLVER